MFNPDTSPQLKFFMYAIEAAAESLGVQVIAAPVRATADIEPALASFGRQPNGGLILTSNTFTNLRYSLIANLAGRYSLPSIASGAIFGKNGGLMYYGSDVKLADEYRGAATYVDRILGFEARRLTRASYGPIYVRHQPQDRQGARSNRARDARRDRQRDDRIGSSNTHWNTRRRGRCVLVSSGGVLSLVISGTPLRLKRRNLKEHVLRRARDLAESGRFKGWQGIEFEVRFFEGFPKARIWLIGPFRRELDDLCRYARIRKSVSTSTETTK
jgi:hypothetical protein